MEGKFWLAPKMFKEGLVGTFGISAPKMVKAGLVGAFGICAAANSYFDVEEGQQALVINGVTGVKRKVVYYPGRHYMIPCLESPAIFDVPPEGLYLNLNALNGPFSKALKKFWRNVCDKADSIDINTYVTRSYGSRSAFAQEAQSVQVAAYEDMRSSLIKRKAELKKAFWAVVVKEKLGGATSTCETSNEEEAQKSFEVLRKEVCRGKKFKDRNKAEYALSPEEIFEMWMVDRNKVYQNEREKRKRFKIFKKNLDERDLYGVETYGLNCFADMTYEEFKEKHLNKFIKLIP